MSKSHWERKQEEYKKKFGIDRLELQQPLPKRNDKIDIVDFVTEKQTARRKLDGLTIATGSTVYRGKKQTIWFTKSK